MKFKLIAISALIASNIYASDKNISQTWLDFVDAQKNNKPSLLLDFSFAGYHHGEKEINPKKMKKFNVCEFGAIPNDNKSDRDALKRAIAAAEKNKGGIIYFPKGRFDLKGENDDHDPIYVRSSNIIFRGEGAGKNGTELFMEYPNYPKDITKLWTSQCLINFQCKSKREKLTDIVADSERGTFVITVASSDKIKAGDWISLNLKNNDPELIAQELAPYEVDKKWTDLTKNGVTVNDYHQVVKVEGNKVTLKEPIMYAIQSKWKWTVNSFSYLEEIGIEDIAFVGNWKDKFIHHKDWLHDGGYKPLFMSNVVNSWMRNCRFTDISEALTIATSANVSVTNCIIDGNMGHSAMRAQGSSRVFFGNIIDKPSQWHSVGFSKPSMGTVLWKIKTKANSCFESHASQPRASLLDACEGGFMRGRAGGAEFNNPNHLKDLFFWNYKELENKKENFDFWAMDTPFWKFMPPVFVGFHGAGTTFKEEEVLLNESHGTPVYPTSLYEAQLKLRLGKLPKWFEKLKKDADSNFEL